MTQPINPYQPPPAETELEADPGGGISFQITERDLNHGESHYMIRCRPYLVTIVSVVMIIVCTGLFMVAVAFLGIYVPLLIMPALLLAAAAAYLAVVRIPKRLTRRRMREHGWTAGVTVAMESTEGDLRIEWNDKTQVWPHETIKTYRTPLGRLIVPEQYLYLFVSRSAKAQQGSYKSFLKTLPQSGKDHDQA